MNNNTTVLVGIIALVIIGAGVYFVYSQDGEMGPNATSTVSGGDSAVVDANGEVITQTPSAPSVSTDATVAPTDTTAVVTGTVVPNGAITNYWYEYGPTTSLGSKTSENVVGSGFASIPTPGYITGLTKNTTYYFRLVAKNQYGQVSGELNQVKTSQNTPAPTVVSPTAKTLTASGITNTSATLSGQVNPNGVIARYWFEYGRTDNFGNTTAITSVGSGNVVVPATAVVTNLQRNTKYFYRINSQNQYGTVNGDIQTFRTK